MSARLISRQAETRGEFRFKDEATLGRSSRSSIVLKPELLSNRHARIWRDDQRGCYMLEDLGSSNGTRLDGEPVVRQEPLGHLHVITLAEHFDFIFIDEARARDRHSGSGLEAAPVAQAVARRIGETSEVTLLESLPLPLPGFPNKEVSEASRELTRLDKLPLPLPGFLQQDEAEGESPGDDPPTVQAGSASAPMGHRSKSASAVPGPARGPAKREPMPTLDLSDQPDESEVMELLAAPEAQFGDTVFLEISTDEGSVRHRLKEGDNLVGRDPRADIRPSSPEVSRRHALFTLEPGKVTVKDLGSRNKTFVEGRVVMEPTELSPGQRIKFGALEARVLADGWEE